MNTTVPIIRPHKSAEYEFQQSKYDVAPRIPFSQIVVGPSGSGKSILLQNMILDVYRNCFQRVFIFSASIHVDSVWHPVKEYIEKTLKVNPKKEKVYFDEFHKEDLEEILEQQYKISQYQKDHKFKKLFATLVVVDDFADQVSFSKHNSMLNALYIRGRHFGVNIVSSTQKFNSLSTIIRVNSRQLYFFKMRNYKDIQTMIDELSTLLKKRNFLSDKNIHNAKNTLLDIYEKATEEKFSFLFVNLMESNFNGVFKIRFDKKVIVDDEI